MKPLLTIAALTLTGFVAMNAQAGERFYDQARVVSAEPTYEIFEHRVPREQCWVETVREEPRRAHRSATSTILGGVIGGAIGNAVGAGDENKKVGAVVGTLLGMSVGHDIERRRRHHEGYNQATYRDVEKCETRYDIEREEKLTGYDVTYKYRGQIYNTHMREHPGKRIKVAVSVEPVGYQF